MSRVRANQNPESPVSTRPLSGISVGSTTSNVEIRSLATSSSRRHPARTARGPCRCRCAWLHTDRFLLRSEAAEPVERGVEVGDGGVQVEDVVQGASSSSARDLRVVADELAEVAFLVPRAHRVALHEPVRLGALHAALDQREQQAVREEQPVRRPEVPHHPLGVDDEPVDDPREAVEHVVEREERVGDR